VRRATLNEYSFFSSAGTRRRERFGWSSSDG
jgi:hypothetical protein